MRGRVVAVCAAVVLAFPLVGGAAGQARGQDTRPGIAVFPFVNSGSFGQDKENFEALERGLEVLLVLDRKSTRLNSSHTVISYAVFCLKKKKSNKSTKESGTT